MYQCEIKFSLINSIALIRIKNMSKSLSKKLVTYCPRQKLESNERGF